ncbi:MAG: protein translocase subunit SecF [Gammaproteobacteria bacterium]
MSGTAETIVMTEKAYKAPNFDFMGQRRIAVILTLLLTLGSLFAIFTRGFNFGIDFTGGAMVELGFKQPANVDEVRAKLEASEFGNATVQLFGTPNEVLVRLPPQHDTAAAQISERILALVPDAEMRRIEFVGPQVGEELAEDGALAMLLAIGGIFVYVMLRFTWKFSVGAIAATLHDIIITLGYFAVTQADFDLTVLAAVLTVLGYSLNDTVVVFDRVRENLRRERKKSVVETINGAINQTLSRTIITAGETFMVVVALFYFGGELLRNFSIALLIGIFVGTYSSIYVATATVAALGISRQDMLPVQKEGAAVDDRP